MSSEILDGPNNNTSHKSILKIWKHWIILLLVIVLLNLLAGSTYLLRIVAPVRRDDILFYVRLLFSPLFISVFFGLIVSVPLSFIPFRKLTYVQKFLWVALGLALIPTMIILISSIMVTVMIFGQAK